MYTCGFCSVRLARETVRLQHVSIQSVSDTADNVMAAILHWFIIEDDGLAVLVILKVKYRVYLCADPVYLETSIYQGNPFFPLSPLAENQLKNQSSYIAKEAIRRLKGGNRDVCMRKMSR